MLYHQSPCSSGGAGVKTVICSEVSPLHPRHEVIWSINKAQLWSMCGVSADLSETRLRSTALPAVLNDVCGQIQALCVLGATHFYYIIWHNDQGHYCDKFIVPRCFWVSDRPAKIGNVILCFYVQEGQCSRWWVLGEKNAFGLVNEQVFHHITWCRFEITSADCLFCICEFQ